LIWPKLSGVSGKSSPSVSRQNSWTLEYARIFVSVTETQLFRNRFGFKVETPKRLRPAPKVERSPYIGAAVGRFSEWDFFRD